LIKVLPLLLFPMLFLSCGFQHFQGVKKNNLNERVFENSAVGQIYRDGKLEMDIKAVYVSDIAKKFQDYETFLVSIYFFDRDIQGLENGNFLFRLNGVAPIRIDRISNTNRAIEQIKLLNRWFSNYIVYFPKLKDDKLVLKFRYGLNRPLLLKFTKGIGNRRTYPSLANKLFSLPKFK